MHTIFVGRAKVPLAVSASVVAKMVVRCILVVKLRNGKWTG